MEQTEEIWKDVDGYEGLYRVSNYGKIMSMCFGKKKEIKLRTISTDKDGYSVIDFWINYGNRKNKKVHRLVGIAFIPNPENKPCINHIDGNKKNNHVSNLEWVTDSENKYHAYNTGLKFMSSGLKIKIAKIKSKKIINNKTGIIYDSLTETCKKEKISSGYLWKILKGKVVSDFDLNYY